jgi:hypothetical protein
VTKEIFVAYGIDVDAVAGWHHRDGRNQDLERLETPQVRLHHSE